MAERRSRVRVVHLCCHCDPENPVAPVLTLAWFRRDCSIHGDCYHRPMIERPDGSLFPLYARTAAAGRREPID